MQHFAVTLCFLTLDQSHVTSSGSDHIYLTPTGLTETSGRKLQDVIPYGMGAEQTGCGGIGDEPFGPLGTNKTVYDIGTADYSGQPPDTTYGFAQGSDANLHWNGTRGSCQAPKSGCHTYVKVTYTSTLGSITAQDIDALTGKIGGEMAHSYTVDTSAPNEGVECMYIDDMGPNCSPRKDCPARLRLLV